MAYQPPFERNDQIDSLCMEIAEKVGCMIISASRRTDIPRLRSDWMLNRIHEGFVDARNPTLARGVNAPLKSNLLG